MEPQHRARHALLRRFRKDPGGTKYLPVGSPSPNPAPAPRSPSPTPPPRRSTAGSTATRSWRSARAPAALAGGDRLRAVDRPHGHRARTPATTSTTTLARRRRRPRRRPHHHGQAGHHRRRRPLRVPVDEVPADHPARPLPFPTRPTPGSRAPFPSAPAPRATTWRRARRRPCSRRRLAVRHQLDQPGRLLVPVAGGLVLLLLAMHLRVLNHRIKVAPDVRPAGRRRPGAGPGRRPVSRSRSRSRAPLPCRLLRPNRRRPSTTSTRSGPSRIEAFADDASSREPASPSREPVTRLGPEPSSRL